MLKQLKQALAMVALTLPLALPASADRGTERVGDQTASFLASPFMAAFDPAPQRPRPPIYSYPIEPPPGMCRWERQILDRSGRPVLDRDGQPMREYTIGPCWRPPF